MATSTPSKRNAAVFADSLTVTGESSLGNITTTGYLRGPSTFTIDPAAHGNDTGTVVIAGNLQIDGTTTTINSTAVTIDDLNLTLASGAATASAANGAGITVDGASATILYNSAGDEWQLNKPLTISGNTVFHDGYHPNADKWTTARTLTLTGAVTGSVSIDGSGNVSLATTATSDPTLTLSGDASGSATFTNLGNATLTVTVADDSHNHIIANIDGLQTALDAKQDSSTALTTSTAFGGDVSGTYNAIVVADDSHTHDGRYYTETESDTRYFRRDASNNVDVRLASGDGRGLRFWDSDSYKIWMSASGNATWGGRLDSTSDYNMYFRMTGGTNRGFVFQNDTTEVFQIESTGQTRQTGVAYVSTDQRVFADNYHPNADKWTTARTLSLTGAVTGSVSIDGSGNVSLATTVNHTHNYDNYVSWTAEDGDGTTYTVTSGDTLKFAEGTAIDVNFTADDVLTISHADTSSQASVNNSNGTIIQDVTLDTNGHVTGLASLDGDARWVNVTGDTMTGILNYPMLVNQTTSNYDTAGDSSGFSFFYGTSSATSKPSGTDHAVTTLSYNNLWQVQEAGDWRTNARYIRKQENGTWSAWQRLFADDYHPNADKWTTARTLSLTGAVTGSASIDGSGNVSLATTVNHTHNYDNYVSWTAEDGDGTTYTVTSGDTLKFAEGSGIDVNFTNDDELTISHADTSSQASVNNSNGTLIQDVTLDGFGHVTGLASLDGDARWVNVTGDTMTGDLVLDGAGLDFVSPDGNNTISLNMLDTDTLSFEGNSGQLFSITDSLTGTIFSVNDISGIPSIEVDDDGTIRFAEFSGNVLIGTSTDDGTNRLQVNGGVTATDLTVTNTITGSIDTADKWTTARTLSLTGAVIGQASIDGSGNVSIATTATSDPTLTLNGDASGSATFTDLGNATLTVTIADDSHNHIIGNVDGLQTALDGKVSDTGDTMTGALIINTSPVTEKISLKGTGTSSISFYNVDDDVMRVSYSSLGFGEIRVFDGEPGEATTLRLRTDTLANAAKISINGGTAEYSMFHDGYHPNADKWTTARTLTLNGDVSGSVSWDGSANATLTTTVANDSHSHSNYVLKAGDTMTGDLTIGDGTADTNLHVKKADNDVSDHIVFYNGTTRVGEIGVQDTTWLRLNQVTAKNIYTPRYIRADGGFFVDGTTYGISETGKLLGNAGTVTGDLEVTGNVGIGTSSPADLLHVKSSTQAVGDYQIIAEGTVGGYGAGISFQSQLTGGALSEMARITADGEAPWDSTAANQDAGLRFYTALDGTVSESMRLTAGGRLGIGTSSPATTLDVNGDATATNFNSTSDERLKSNIETLDGSKVLEMRGVSFIKDGKPSSGVIAQELEKVAPELVHDGEYKTVSYGNIVGYLIEAIKMQQQQIEELKSLIKNST